MPENNTNPTLENKVTSFKEIARESLRMALISPRMTRISGFENSMKENAKGKARIEKNIEVIKFEIQATHEDHPAYEEIKEEKEGIIKNYEGDLKIYEEAEVEYTKEIDHQKECIAKIESGETLVSSEKLNTLVDSMIIKYAMDQTSK